MTYIIAVFNSRNETLYFANLLKRNNIQAFVVNTPKEAGLTCGISVKIDERSFPLAKYLLSSKPFRAFHGFYRVKNEGIKSTFERLN